MPAITTAWHVLWVACGCLGALCLTCAAAVALLVACEGWKARRWWRAALTDEQFEAELDAYSLRDAGGAR